MLLLLSVASAALAVAPADEAVAASVAAPASLHETVVYGNVAGGLGFLLQNIGDFAVGAEHRIGPHGLLAEGTLIHVHGHPTHATTYGAQAGYRYHFGAGSGAFLGVVGGYEVGKARYYKVHHGGDHWLFELAHWSATAHLGHRWVVVERVAITARFGAGYGHWAIVAPGAGLDAQAALLRDRVQFTPVKLDAELSVGVRF